MIKKYNFKLFLSWKNLTAVHFYGGRFIAVKFYTRVPELLIYQHVDVFLGDDDDFLKLFDLNFRDFDVFFKLFLP
jgi:hypothetical protein